MGRNVAGESFFRALSVYPDSDAITALVESDIGAQTFVLAVSRWNPALAARIIRSDPSEVEQCGTLFLGDPTLAEYAWRRAPYGARSWSLCGLTHTISTHVAMDALLAMAAAPVEPWDALVCTSSAVKTAVLNVLQANADFLQQRLGASRTVLPMLPVIPLGVHAADFAFSSADRATARKKVGLPEDTVAILFVGRLIAHAKANPIPLYLALEQAATQTGRSIALIEYGRFPNKSIEASFQEAALTLCPSVRRIVVDGASEGPDHAWAAADIFTSLSDNIQEAFGITPVEAMASGLPVVVSDWDGYRETVRDGIDGFRVPTILPRAGLGQDFARRHMLGLDTYDQYVGYTSAATAVDVEAAASAFVTLIESADLRRAFGVAGRKRVREIYDWPVVLAQYDELWREMAECRHAASEVTPFYPPSRDDPFRTFAGYSSATLDESTTILLARTNAAEAFARFEERSALGVIGYARPVMASAAEVQAMLNSIELGPLSAGDLVALVAADRRPVALRSIAWLLKLGIVRRAV